MGFRYRGGLRSQLVGKLGSWYFPGLTFVPATAIQAFGHDGGTIFSYRCPVVRRNNWLHNSHLDNEACSSLCRAVCVSSYHDLADAEPLVSFLMAQSYAGFICFLTWTSSTFARPPSKRAVALAFINAFSQLGNIAGSCVLHVVTGHLGW